MKTTPWIKLCKGAALALAVSYGLTYCHTTKSKLTLEQKGDSLTVIHITYPANYILLPIEEEAMESQVLLDTGEATDTDMDIRLAQTKVDYFVPLALPAGAKTATVRVRNKSKDALCWKEIKLSIQPLRFQMGKYALGTFRQQRSCALGTLASGYCP